MVSADPLGRWKRFHHDTPNINVEEEVATLKSLKGSGKEISYFQSLSYEKRHALIQQHLSLVVKCCEKSSGDMIDFFKANEFLLSFKDRDLFLTKIKKEIDVILATNAQRIIDYFKVHVPENLREILFSALLPQLAEPHKKNRAKELLMQLSEADVKDTSMVRMLKQLFTAKDKAGRLLFGIKDQQECLEFLSQQGKADIVNDLYLALSSNKFGAERQKALEPFYNQPLQQSRNITLLESLSESQLSSKDETELIRHFSSTINPMRYVYILDQQVKCLDTLIRRGRLDLACSAFEKLSIQRQAEILINGMDRVDYQFCGEIFHHLKESTQLKMLSELSRHDLGRYVFPLIQHRPDTAVKMISCLDQVLEGSTAGRLLDVATAGIVKGGDRRNEAVVYYIFTTRNEKGEYLCPMEEQTKCLNALIAAQKIEIASKLYGIVKADPQRFALVSAPLREILNAPVHHHEEKEGGIVRPSPAPGPQ